MSHKGTNLPHSKSAQTAAEAPAGRSANNQNKRAVQLLREGKADEAVSILRKIVLSAGGTWMRPDVPNAFKRNFATALLLSGKPSGCLEVLGEMNDDSHPRVQQLREAVKRWEKTLSFFQWLDWRMGRIDPANRPVSLDFVAGEIEEGAS